jgi:N-acetyltransferase
MTPAPNLDTPNLENEHVRLDVVTAADREGIALESVIQSMWKWLPVIGTGTNFDVYFDRVLASARSGELVPFKVTRQCDQAFAGLVAFEAISRTHRRLRIGFAWHPEDMRGTYIGPATQLALLERAYDARFRRIEFEIPEENKRAVAAAERLGCTCEGVLRNYYRLAGGGWANIVNLSLVENEIPLAARRLRERIQQMQAA